MNIEQSVSQKIIDQTNLALKYIDDASDIIIHKKLFPVDQDEINDFTKETGKVLPLDYTYWLLTQGCGFIDFLNNWIVIPSLHDIKENEKLASYLGHTESRKKIAIPQGFLDVGSSDNGCCPVINMHIYSDIINTVYASSWQMLIIRSIIDITNSLYWEIEGKKLYDIHDAYFPGIDHDLEKAHYRAIKLDRSDEYEIDEDACIKTDIFNESIDTFSSGYIENIEDAIKMIDDGYEKGATSFSNASGYIRYESEKKDLPKLYGLLKHPVRSVRHDAFSAIKRLEAPKGVRRIVYTFFSVIKKLVPDHTILLSISHDLDRLRDFTRDIELKSKIDSYEDGLKFGNNIEWDDVH